MGFLLTFFTIWLVLEYAASSLKTYFKEQLLEANKRVEESAAKKEENKKEKEKYEEHYGIKHYESRELERSYSEATEKVSKINEKIELLLSIRFLIRSALIVVFIFTTIFKTLFILDEQNYAVVTTFGNPKEVTKTGLNFKVPFIQKVTKVDKTIQGLAIGYAEEDSESSNIEESMMITKDFNFVNVDFYIEYKVSDPINYLYGSSDPKGILSNVAQSCIRNTIGGYDVDSVLTTGKNEIQSVVKQQVIQELDSLNTGLQIVNITIQDSEPPTDDVKAAFKQVEQAKQEADTARNQAEQYKNEQLPTANANADEIKRQAEATKQERIDQATGEVAMFNAMYAEYVKNPDVTKMRLYYEAMEELLPNLQIIVNGTDAELKPILKD